MLAAAAAGVLTPDLDSEMRSRVVRAVEQLEPSDVIVLRQAESTSPGQALKYLGAGPEARAALFSSGCLVLVGGGMALGQNVEVTPIGRAVLKTLEAWRPSGAGS